MDTETNTVIVTTAAKIRVLFEQELTKVLDKLNVDVANIEQAYLNQKQAAKYVNVSTNTLRYWQEVGLVKVYGLPGSNGININRYKKTQLDEAVKSTEIQRHI